jgi:hypothetical protein
MENTEWFQKYLDQALNEEDLKLFESLILTEPDFSQEFEIYKQIAGYNNTKDKKRKSRDILNDVNNEFTFKSEPKWSIRYKLFIILGGIIIVSIFCYYILRVPKQIESKYVYASLFEMYFNPTQISLTEKSTENQTIIDSIVLSYNTQDYDQVITLIKTIDKSKQKEEATLIFIEGVALVHESKCVEAIKLLEELGVRFDIFSNEANYYISLCHIKNNDYLSARISLLKINPESNIHRISKKLLDEIEKK